MRSVPVNKVKQFEAEFLLALEQRHPDTLASLKAGKLDDAVEVLEKVAKEISSKY